LKSEAECQQYRTSLDYWIVRYLPSQRKEALSASNVSPEERAAYLEAYRDRLLALESTAPIEFEVAAQSA